MPSCLVIQHIEPEGSYAIGEALTAAGVEVTVCRVYAADGLPADLADFDGLVVMGGPMSAASDEGFASRRQEIALLEEAVELEIPTLGVCLGAQLLAVATGGQVMAGTSGMEVGWAPVALSNEAHGDPLLSGIPAELTLLHWHGDTYELPPRAVRLASNSRYLEQAFRVGSWAWGLQSHVEVDHSAVDAFLGAFGEDAIAAGTTPGEIRDATPNAVQALRPHRDEILGRFAAMVADRVATLTPQEDDELAELG